MIRFRKLRRPIQPLREPATLPATADGAPLYAIGDIHGRNDLLQELINLIRVDMAEVSSTGRASLVFLGDYVDRGPTSKQVIDTIIGLQADPAFEVIALRGNHDQFMLEFLADAAKGPTWMTFGGGPTLVAYGVTPPRRSDEHNWIEASKKLGEALPPSHRVFLESLPYFAVSGDYVFVHAGVRPNIELRRQSASDVLCIRDTFLDTEEPIQGGTVVFGHTPFDRPFVEKGKIGLDTGACVTGVLTALCLQSNRRRFLQTGPAGGVSDVPEPSVGKEARPRRL